MIKNNMEEHLISICFFCIGWLAGKVLDHYFFFLKKKYKNWKLQKSQDSISINYDSQNNGLILLHSWSYSHRLLPSNTNIKVVERPNNAYIKHSDTFQSIVDKYKSQNIRGEICYMVNYNVDHMDNEYGKTFDFYVAPCDYSEASSISEYLELYPEVKENIISTIKKSPKEYFAQAMPSDVFMNLIVICNGKILALRRSNSVSSARGLWCIGAYETMEMPSSTTCNDTNFHKLAERCIKEEIGLTSSEIGSKTGDTRYFFNSDSIFISSIHLSLFHMGTLVTAIVILNDITLEEVSERIVSVAHSKYEHDAVEWINLDKKEIKSFLENGDGYYADFVNKKNGQWIAYAKSSLYEIYRSGEFDKFTI